MQTPDHIAEFLSEARVAVFSTVDTKGRPHAIPMWCIYDNGEFVMYTGPKSQKYKNVENNENVMLVYDTREAPYYALMVRGTAQVETSDNLDLIERIATAYVGEEAARKYLAGRSGAGGGVIRITPWKYIEYHGMSGR